MFNAIVGDFCGSSYEGGDLKGYSLPLLPNTASFTDDSVMIAATMDVINQAKASGDDLTALTEKDFAKAYKTWGMKYLNQGFSPDFRRWLNDKSLSPTSSIGSLAPVRAIPIGFTASPECLALDLAEISAKATHDSMEAINASRAVVHAMICAREGKTQYQVLDLIEGLYFLPLITDFKEAHQSGGFDTTAEHCAGMGISIGMAVKNVEEAIRLSLYVGGDTDTIAAIACAICDARQPNVAIPTVTQTVKDRISATGGEDILAVYDQFERNFGVSGDA